MLSDTETQPPAFQRLLQGALILAPALSYGGTHTPCFSRAQASAKMQWSADSDGAAAAITTAGAQPPILPDLPGVSSALFAFAQSTVKTLSKSPSASENLGK